MTNRTPAELIAALKESGLFVVKDGIYYFIPVSTMAECKLPPEFQGDSELNVQHVFEPINGTSASADLAAKLVHKGLDVMLSELRVVDGVSQAIWVAEEETENNRQVSRSEGSKSVMFVYSTDGTKIVVDMSKGGKLSRDT